MLMLSSFERLPQHHHLDRLRLLFRRRHLLGEVIGLVTCRAAPLDKLRKAVVVQLQSVVVNVLLNVMATVKSLFLSTARLRARTNALFNTSSRVNSSRYCQPHDKCRMFLKSFSGEALVNMSAFCFLVSTFAIRVVRPTCVLKNQHFAAMCLDLGVNFGTVASINAPLLSSNTADKVLHFGFSFMRNDLRFCSLNP